MFYLKLPLTLSLPKRMRTRICVLNDRSINRRLRQGLTRDIARQFVASTFVGAAQMVKDSKEHPGQLKDKVTSPGGVTIQALHILEKAGVRGVLWDAVNRAMERSKEMESEYSGGRG